MMGLPIESILLIGFLLLLLVFLFTRRKSRRERRHQLYFKKAKRIARKITTFQEPGKNAKALTYLRKINPFVFEEILLLGFQAQGYKVVRNRKYTGDGGLDGKVYDQQGRLIVIQAKRYKSYIKLQDVVEFASLVNESKATFGLFIHTGRTGKGVYQHIRYERVKIISGTRLIALVDQAGMDKRKTA
jgi:restriction system protein